MTTLTVLLLIVFPLLMAAGVIYEQTRLNELNDAVFTKTEQYWTTTVNGIEYVSLDGKSWGSEEGACLEIQSRRLRHLLLRQLAKENSQT
jgi:sugar lactone lactonase YvrE